MCMKQIFVLIFALFLVGCTVAQDCGTIEDEDEMNNCYRNMANKENNTGYCLKITKANKQNLCISDVAELNEDAETCLMIPSKTVSNQCIKDIALMTLDLETCLMTTDYVQESTCFKLLAEELNNKAICENIRVNEIKNNCLGDEI